MPRWLMKTADDTYREWSTVVDDWVSDPMNRAQAITHSTHDTPLMAGDSDLSREAAEERLRFVDEHLCSCRARLGESVEIRDGVPVATGGGRLAYHFDNYEEVARFCRTQDERRGDSA